MARSRTPFSIRYLLNLAPDECLDKWLLLAEGPLPPAVLALELAQHAQACPKCARELDQVFDLTSTPKPTSCSGRHMDCIGSATFAVANAACV